MNNDNYIEEFDEEFENEDYIILDCPVCGEETDFTILKNPPEAVVQCVECGHTMRITLKEPKSCMVKAIISHGSESIPAKIELIEGEMVRVGDFLVAEAGEETYNVEVLSIEENNARRDKMPAEKINTLWTRLVDLVIISASVNKGARTVPLYEQVDGETKYMVDSIATIAGKQFRVVRIKLRKGNMLMRKGKTAKAYEIKRIYGERS
ncbi:MAG TPA: HVO_0476 family zinc finger protein [Methanocorpusculum sp.]|nr:HVO_0476 family zinc finger protein [Methanocorpusculum sp.]